MIPASKNNNENQKRKRKHNIIWFNSQYSKDVKTIIGKTFLQILTKQFPKDHQLHKIFNKSTVKISYNCITISVQDYPPIIKKSLTQNKHLLVATP